MVTVAVQDNPICTSADIDTYVQTTDGTTWVVQAGGEEAAFILTDVTEPTSPVMYGPFVWLDTNGNELSNTYTPDAKAFERNNRYYVAFSLERLSILNAACGVIIADVTDVKTAESLPLVQVTGSDWCDVHNSFVEDVGGDGRWLYLTADAPNDMRVVDLDNLEDVFAGTPSQLTEVGRYTAITANNNNYVHDITVADHGDPNGRRVYLAYWDTGLVVLDAGGVTPGTNPTLIIGAGELDPDGFLNHHSFPTQDGNFVFIQDEFLDANGDEPVQMWDISDPDEPVHADGLELGTDVDVNPAHNLEIRNDIDSNRLYTGWYKLGLQAWDFDATIATGGFINMAIPSADVSNQVQTHKKDNEYDGAWAVRMESITHDVTPAGSPTNPETNLYVFTSDRRYGLIIDCVDDPAFSSYCPDPALPDGDGGNGGPNCNNNSNSPKCR